MSRQFLKVSTASLKELKDVYEQQVYLYLKKNINIAGFCSGSYSKIAEALHICRAKVVSVISSLVSKGLIKKETSINKDGSYMVNQYYLLDISSFWKNRYETRKKMLDDYSANTDAFPTEKYSFVKVFYDFLESAKLSVREKSIYIALLSFRNSETGLCCPGRKTLAEATDCCVKTASKYINKLIEKGLIKKETYYNSKTSKMASCRYKLYDFEYLFKDKSNKALAEEPEGTKEEDYTRKHRKKKENKGYVERYSYDEVVDIFHRDELYIIAKQERISSREVDAAINIIYHELNSKDKTFSYKGDIKPHTVLEAAYWKLSDNPYAIIHAINTYLSQENRIENPEAYMKILLYRASDQTELRVANDVRADKA